MESQKLEGMGSILGENGVTFRVWAPHADQVFVMGEFSEWREEQFPLDHEGDGYWAVHVNEANAGDEYKFIIINGDQRLHKNDPYALKLTHSNGNSVIYNPFDDWKNHEFRIAPFNELVIYELHIGTFNREGLNDGEVGTFYSAVEKLDYLQELGINAIELMPISEFSGDSSWGYNPSHPFAVETAYGGPEGLKHFIYEAHIRGIAVILDVVYNHFGPSDMDLWQFDGWSENGYGGIYFYNDERAKTPWGENRPDFGRKEVRNYIRDNAMMWLHTHQCDGLRLDATAMIRFLGYIDPTDRTILEDGFSFLQDLIAEIRAEFPHKILIAEDLKEDAAVTAPISKNGLGFHAQWGVGFADYVKRVLLEVEDRHRNLQMIVESLFFSFNNDVFQRIIFTESHDEVANGSSRLPEEIDPGNADGEYAKKKSTLGAITLFTSAGIPMIFQGQEFMTHGYFSDSEELNWEKQKENQGISQMYRDLIWMRSGRDKDLVGLTGHKIETLHFHQDKLVLAFSRTHLDFQDRPVIVILNFSSNEYFGYRIGIPFESELDVKFNSGWKGYDEDFSDTTLSGVQIEGAFEGQAHSIKVDLPSFGGVILVRK
ncbi:alpha-amylase family glycosyl hydrolase [Aquiflexum lacus]|uniref:alpha-amylase family glycosyl hydrolase n=1 Tax=Aquiflexum lacus TaxID=2483805 RepID=UPI0018956C4F|nr:alpha-amylase family glycosyl hydrolase [Aquiflexum lacus]